MEVKCVISDVKTGKSYQRSLTDDSLTSRKIGETVPGSLFGLPGYELQITGGSDTAGFPMRKSIEGGGRKKALIHSNEIKGNMIRKTVRGNTINAFTAQVSLKVTKAGSKSMEELWGIQPKVEEAPVAAAAK